MSNNNQEQDNASELNQEHMLELISLPNSMTREVQKKADTKEVLQTTIKSTSENVSDAKEVEISTVKQEQPERKEPKRKKPISGTEDYETVFIQPGKLNVRNGKAIYIRPEFHKTIARIVQTVGDGKVSLTDYVDNVFAHHFRHFEQEIKESFNKNNEPIL